MTTKRIRQGEKTKRIVFVKRCNHLPSHTTANYPPAPLPFALSFSFSLSSHHVLLLLTKIDFQLSPHAQL